MICYCNRKCKSYTGTCQSVFPQTVEYFHYSVSKDYLNEYNFHICGCIFYNFWIVSSLTHCSCCLTAVSVCNQFWLICFAISSCQYYIVIWIYNSVCHIHEQLPVQFQKWENLQSYIIRLHYFIQNCNQLQAVGFGHNIYSLFVYVLSAISLVLIFVNTLHYRIISLHSKLAYSVNAKLPVLAVINSSEKLHIIYYIPYFGIQ